MIITSWKQTQIVCSLRKFKLYISYTRKNTYNYIIKQKNVSSAYLTFILHLDGIRPSISSYLFFYDIAYLSMSLTSSSISLSRDKLLSVFKFKQKKTNKNITYRTAVWQLVLEGIRVYPPRVDFIRRAAHPITYQKICLTVDINPTTFQQPALLCLIDIFLEKSSFNSQFSGRFSTRRKKVFHL